MKKYVFHSITLTVLSIVFGAVCNFFALAQYTSIALAIRQGFLIGVITLVAYYSIFGFAVFFKEKSQVAKESNDIVILRAITVYVVLALGYIIFITAGKTPENLNNLIIVTSLIFPLLVVIEATLDGIKYLKK